MINIDQLKQVEIKIGEIISAEKVEGADKLLKLMVNFGTKVSPPIATEVPVSVASAMESTSSVVEAVPSEVEKDVRQIISGIAPYFSDPVTLVGLKCAFVTNLEPRTIRGLQSNGMILATGGGNDPFTLLRANADTVPGSLIR